MTWKGAWENPIVLAAFVGAMSSLGVSIVGGVSGAVSGYFQAAAQSKLAVLNQALGTAAPEQRMEAFVAAGLLDDSDCKIRRAAFHYNNACQPPKTASGQP